MVMTLQRESSAGPGYMQWHLLKQAGSHVALSIVLVIPSWVVLHRKGLLEDVH